MENFHSNGADELKSSLEDSLEDVKYSMKEFNKFFEASKFSHSGQLSSHMCAGSDVQSKSKDISADASMLENSGVDEKSPTTPGAVQLAPVAVSVSHGRGR